MSSSDNVLDREVETSGFADSGCSWCRLRIEKSSIGVLNRCCLMRGIGASVWKLLSDGSPVGLFTGSAFGAATFSSTRASGAFSIGSADASWLDRVASAPAKLLAVGPSGT